MSPWEAFGFWTTLIFYTLSFASGLVYLFWRKGWGERGLWLGTFIGAFFHGCTFLVRFITASHIPTIGTYENILTGTLVTVILAFLFSRKKHPGILVGTLPFLLLLLGIAAFSSKEPQPFLASLKSFWLYIHIFFAWLAYGAFTAFAGVALVYLWKAKKGEEASVMDELMFRLTAFGLITQLVMIAAGSLWAKDLWGSYWSWDPVETWSLISFLLYGLILHGRITLRWRGKVLAYFLLFALITVLISFWGVNFVMKGTLHIFTVD